MITRKRMQTIKNLIGKNILPIAVATALVAGCGEPGPRALFKGRNLIEKGQFAQAAEKLRAACLLLTNNANAYNDLGLACHYAGETADAEKAYRRAIALDPDLTEARFNLGCLLLDQKNFEGAKAEFTAYTLRRGNAVEGFLKLGTAQLRAGHAATGQKRQIEVTSAERTFDDALRLAPGNPEAFSGAGLARLLRGRPDEAAQYFQSALRHDPSYAPAMLNLAVVQQLHLKDRPAALRTYRNYLALKPAPADSEAVQSIVTQLEREPTAPASGSVPPIQTTLPSSRTLATEAPAAPPASKPALPAAPPKIAAQTAAAVTAPPPHPVVVIVPPEPVLKAAQEPSSGTVQPKAPSPAPLAPAPPSTVEAGASPSAKRSFWQKLNPVNLFSKGGSSTEGRPAQQAEGPDGVRRYAYKNPPAPIPGQRSSAERAFAQGVQAHQAHRLPEAIQAYRRATQLDPAYFEATYNLALTATESGNLALALSAYETALVVRPQSLDARYNFALLLKQANYPLDAAGELEKLLANNPNDSRGHLAIGNLYAQQLKRSDKALYHYMKVLELDPRNPQAAAIRSWITENPR